MFLNLEKNVFKGKLLKLATQTFYKRVNLFNRIRLMLFVSPANGATLQDAQESNFMLLMIWS